MKRLLLAVLVLAACDYQLPDEPVVESPESSALAAAIKYAIETRELEQDYHVTVITADDALMESLEDHVVRIATHSVKECEPTGETLDMEGTPLEVSRCTFPADRVELIPSVEQHPDGSYHVTIEEIARTGLITAPGHWMGEQPSYISYRMIVRWDDDGWDVELDENWGTEI